MILIRAVAALGIPYMRESVGFSGLKFGFTSSARTTASRIVDDN